MMEIKMTVTMTLNDNDFENEYNHENDNNHKKDNTLEFDMKMTIIMKEIKKNVIMIYKIIMNLKIMHNEHL